MPESEQCTAMSDKRKIPEMSEQWRGIPNVAVLADGQQWATHCEKFLDSGIDPVLYFVVLQAEASL